MWLGSDYKNDQDYNTTKNTTDTDKYLAAISQGGKNENINEDSLRIVNLDQYGTLYIVTDGNKGEFSSETAVTKFPEILLKNLKNNSDNIQKSLYLSLLELDNYLRENKPELLYYGNPYKSLSQTTFLVTLKKDNQVHYMSIGDSYLYKETKENMTLINEKNHDKPLINKHMDGGVFLGNNRSKISKALLEFLKFFKITTYG